mgnify:CR=1 FL=1
MADTNQTDKFNAEVISVFPNKVRISVDNLEDFQVADEKLRVGSYLQIADNDDCKLMAIIENFSIEGALIKKENQYEAISSKHSHWV